MCVHAHTHTPMHTHFPTLSFWPRGFFRFLMVWKNPNKTLGQPMFLVPSPWQLAFTPEDIQSLRKAGLGLVISH